MTATQLFLQFLREECDVGEYLFFREIISHDPGNKYFKNRPLFKKDFVEGYLTRNNRQLYGFMKRIFVLAPNLVRKRVNNPMWKKIVKEHTSYTDEEWNRWGRANLKRCGSGMYVKKYCDKWYHFLATRVEGNKSPYSCFKKGEDNQFTIKPRSNG